MQPLPQLRLLGHENLARSISFVDRPTAVRCRTVTHSNLVEAQLCTSSLEGVSLQGWADLHREKGTHERDCEKPRQYCSVPVALGKLIVFA
jgi:hypothetical protein